MKKDIEKTKTIFKILNGEVIAIFPEVPGTNDPYTCGSYMHNGQHSSCDLNYVIRRSKLAKPEEYADLKNELEYIGYNIEVIKTNKNSFYDIRYNKILKEIGFCCIIK
jgi:predicted nucleotidyltransferase